MNLESQIFKLGLVGSVDTNTGSIGFRDKGLRQGVLLVILVGVLETPWNIERILTF